MQRFFTLLIFLSLAGMVTAQSGLAVSGFQLLANDMTARSLNPERDANGELTALIKVETTATGFSFDGGSLGIVKVVSKPAEYWVYVPAGARALTIAHPQLGMLRNYAYPLPIQAGNVYALQLVHGTVETVVKEAEILSEFVIISSEPPGADVYLNDEPVGKTPFQSEKPEGRYEWRVVRDLYLPEAGVFELKAGSKQKLDLKLKPNFGSVEVVSEPEAGAAIAVNGFKLGKTTPATLEEVPSGEQTLTLTHEWYETTTQTVNVVAGQAQKLRVAMQPNFAQLTVAAQIDEEVYVNDSRKGSGRYTERVAPGVYRVEVRKASHTPATKQVTLSRGDNETIALTPQPILSSLKVVSDPMEAEIYLNGKLVGTTPQIVRELLIGNYALGLRKAGYGNAAETVTVKEGETVEVNLSLSSTGAIAFTSDPQGAEVHINGRYQGRTPYTAIHLPAGDCSYELRKEGYEILSGSGTVESGKTAQVFEKLESSRKPYEPEMVFVEGGRFTMGCTGEQSDCDDNEKPPHAVTVSSFQIGKYEVTQSQWRAVMGKKPSYFSGCDNCPVENVSWNDLQDFLLKLNQQTGKNYRLPTEAEWEYAARGGGYEHRE
ncbi:MAG: PEGA domain-containing protein [Flavobacteriales bacterium]